MATTKYKEIAQKRFKIIEPFVGDGVACRSDVVAQAERCGVHTATIYRWLKLYRIRAEITDLIPKKRGWAKGRSRLSEETKNILQKVLSSHLAKYGQLEPKAVIEEVYRRCEKAECEPPSGETVRQHIRAATS